MSKIIYVCYKDSAECTALVEKKIEKIAGRITPDNIIPRPTKIVRNVNVVYGIINPATSIEENGNCVLLGMAFGNKDSWWKPGKSVPNGSFSIFRSGLDQTELITDAAASRSIWYFHNQELFVACSSQRAIIDCTRHYKQSAGF